MSCSAHGVGRIALTEVDYPRRIIFDYAQPVTAQQAAPADTTFLYSAAPIVELEELPPDAPNVYLRHAEQDVGTLQATLAAAPPFGIALNERYRAFRVTRRFAADPDAEPLGNRPLGLVDAATRRGQTPPIESLAATPGDGRVLYLFNVIVALEWIPSKAYLASLAWAMRRASDLLYDISNGTLAFGQVVVGDRRWMACADIQMMASNRVLPRSWVSGLLVPEKYMPIRVGRGVWTKRRNVAIDWDEPDAYRTLIHEWAHYALNKRDEYLTPGTNDPNNYVNKLVPTSSDATVIIPRQQNTSASIMATPEGNSELENPIDIPDQAQFYPRLTIPIKPFAGPGMLPLPLPIIQYDDRLRAVLDDLGTDEELLVPGRSFPAAVTNGDVAQWSVLVLRPAGSAAQRVTRVIGQGTLDGRVQPENPEATAGTYTVLGAQVGDRVLLTRSADAGILAYQATIGATHQSVWSPLPASWTQIAAPAELLLSVMPEAVGTTPSGQKERIVQIAVGGAAPTLPPLAVFALGGDGPATQTPSQTYAVPSLDGHIVAEIGDELLVTSYSQGGGPASVPNVPTNPITAGSADGEALLFFDTDRAAKAGAAKPKAAYAKVRVVTTTSFARGLDPAAGVAASNVYGMASNKRLPAELWPTLVILVDQGRLTHGRVPMIHRRVGGAWVPLPTYIEPGATFAATPLAAQFLNPVTNADEPIGGSLIARGKPHAEYFRLFFVPEVR